MSHNCFHKLDPMDKPYYKTEHKHFCAQKITDPVLKQVLTGIMCDLGPMNKKPETIKRLIEAGMTIAKINVRSLDLELAVKLIQNIRQAVAEVSNQFKYVYPLALMAVIQNPSVTIGDLAGGPEKVVHLEEGCTVKLTQDSAWQNCSTELCLYVIGWDSIGNLHKDNIIYIDSTYATKVKLIVDEAGENFYNCTVVIGGYIGSRMPIRLSHVPIDLNKDTYYISHQVRWAIGSDVDAILVPNTRTVNDITEMKLMLKNKGEKSMLIFAGIETALGLSNLNDILEVADGIFFDRRSICNELPVEKLFLVQKILAAKCKDVGKPFVCQAILNDQAPDVCVNDIANVVMDGVDVIYIEIDYHSPSNKCIEARDTLSMAEHCIKAVKVVCRQAESVTWKPFIYANMDLMRTSGLEFPVQIICLNAIELALRSKAVIILCLTKSGKTAKLLSLAHSKLPIIALTRVAETAKALSFWKGCKPLLYLGDANYKHMTEVENKTMSGVMFARRNGLLKLGDAYVLVFSSRKGTGYCEEKLNRSFPKTRFIEDYDVMRTYLERIERVKFRKYR